MVPDGRDIPGVCPFYITDDVEGFIDFCKTWLKGQVAHLLTDQATGTARYAEIKVGESLLMVTKTGNSLAATRNHTMVSVEDCVSLYGRAVAAGVVSVQAPVAVHHSGETYAGIADGCGNVWWLSTRTERLSYREQQERYQQKRQP